MVSASLLAVPTEILDRIYSYVDWDCTASLYPERPDLINISLTCRHLRNAVLPLLFKNVVLRLRWVDGALIEPALYRLRRDAPHFARHVRSVYIQTEFAQYVDPEFKLKGFEVPEGLSDWVNPAAVPDNPEYVVEQNHRQRVDEVARNLFEGIQDSSALEDCSGELRDRITSFLHHIFGRTRRSSASSASGSQIQRQSTHERLGESNTSSQTIYATPQLPDSRNEDRGKLLTMKLQMDALVVVMLCLPATVTSLAFEAHPRGRMDTVRNAFCLHVLVAALKIFADRLQRLSVITSPPQAMARAHNPERIGLDAESTIIDSETLDRLEKLTTLVISDYDGVHSTHRNLMAESQTQWHALGSKITYLELRNLAFDFLETLPLFKKFERLQRLTFHNVMLVEYNSLQPRRPVIDRSVWLRLLVALRRDFPCLEMRLARLRGSTSAPPLPPSAVRWLDREAVPVGSIIGYDREARLTEDFASFLDLWIAEDDDQSGLVRDFGPLVDAALTSRWKTFSNQR